MRLIDGLPIEVLNHPVNFTFVIQVVIGVYPLLHRLACFVRGFGQEPTHHPRARHDSARRRLVHIDHQPNIAGEGEFIDHVLSAITPIVGDGFLSD